MALKACRECGKPVSTTASKCPHCGTPHPTSSMSKGSKGCLWVIGAVFSLGVLSTLFSDMDSPPTAGQQIGPALSEHGASTADSSFYFVKRLLNATPAEVAAVLGKPDNELRSTTDCVYLERCVSGSYKKGAYDIEYLSDRVKTVTVLDSKINSKPYAPQFLTSLNLSGTPTVTNAYNIRWRNIANGAIDEVVIFPGKPTGIHYALINVNPKWNRRLQITESSASK